MKGTGMDFKQTQQAFTRLKDQFEQGSITAEEFETRVNEMVVTDSAGVLWQIGVSSGKWYRFDGQNWVEDVPPGVNPPVIQSAPIPPPPPQLVPVGPPSKPFNWFWIVGGLVGLTFLACVGLLLILFVFNQNKPVPANPVLPQPVITQPAAPAIPTVSIVETPQSGPIAGPGFDPNGIFVDDFSDPNSGWGRDRSDDHIMDYEKGGYRIWVNKAQYMYWVTPGKNFPEDVIVEVDATKTGGSDENEFGIICRYQNENNYYMFTISSDGYMLISKEQEGEQVGLSSEQMESTDVIHQGSASNHIRAECKGNSLVLFVNNEKVASAVDSSFMSGDVGLLVATFDTPGVDILFDDFFASSR
jgi:hypothetical protein